MGGLALAWFSLVGTPVFSRCAPRQLCGATDARAELIESSIAAEKIEDRGEVVLACNHHHRRSLFEPPLQCSIGFVLFPGAEVGAGQLIGRYVACMGESLHLLENFSGVVTSTGKAVSKSKVAEKVEVPARGLDDRLEVGYCKLRPLYSQKGMAPDPADDEIPWVPGKRPTALLDGPIEAVLE